MSCPRFIRYTPSHVARRVRPMSGDYTCDMCGEKGLSAPDMRTHMRVAHLDAGPSCPFCPFADCSADQIAQHVRSEHAETDDYFTDNGPPSPPVIGRPKVMILQADTAGTDGAPAPRPGGAAPTWAPVIKLSRVPVRGKPPPAAPRFDCPVCPWTGRSAAAVTAHVDASHAAVDTDNNVVSQAGGAPECPICELWCASAAELETHVNAQHADVLSPAKRSPRRSLEGSTSGCPVCGKTFDDSSKLTEHVNEHFSPDSPTSVSLNEDALLAEKLAQMEKENAEKEEKMAFEKLQEQYGVKGNSNYTKQAKRGLTEAVERGQLCIEDYYKRKCDVQQATETGVDDDMSSTKGIIEKLEQFYMSSPGGNTASLCSLAHHFAVSHGDKGWGCGYRNLQMILSCLATSATYRQDLFGGRTAMPSVMKIQRLIEAAWRQGYDHEGCQQLDAKLVNTTKWIGATDIVAMMASLGVRCRLIDFHAPSGQNGTHPCLFEWVKDYFEDSNTPLKPPLYLQHQGHSRTIVGVERARDGSVRLLLFDPSCSRHQMAPLSREVSASLVKSLRRPLSGMRAKQYQIVAVVGLLSKAEQQESKVLKSERIP